MSSDFLGLREAISSASEEMSKHSSCILHCCEYIRPCCERIPNRNAMTPFVCETPPSMGLLYECGEAKDSGDYFSLLCARILGVRVERKLDSCRTEVR